MELLENTICEVEGIIKSSDEGKTMSETINNIPIWERDLIVQRIGEIKESINYMAQTLGLNRRREEVRDLILGAMTIERVNLEEIKSKRLRGYGEVPENLREFLDLHVDRIMALIDEICNIAGQESTKKKA